MTKRSVPVKCCMAGVHSRREFLQTASVMATSLVTAPLVGTEPSAALPTVALGPRRVTRLIAGNNPMYGYSHFNRLLDRLMVEYIKPTDGVIVGMYPRYSDQIGENVAVARELAA